jgi:hypothetical protein
MRPLRGRSLSRHCSLGCQICSCTRAPGVDCPLYIIPNLFGGIMISGQKICTFSDSGGGIYSDTRFG